MFVKTIDGTPDAVKVACPVLVGGKAGDYIKGLPIETGRAPVLLRPHRLHLVRGGARGAQLHHPAGPHQRQRGAGGRRGVSVPRGSAVRQAGEGAPGPLRREAIPQIQNGRGCYKLEETS